MSNTPGIKKHRKAAYKAQCGRCYYCNVPTWETNKEAFAKLFNLTPKQADALRSTAEHLDPQSDGGDNSQENIVSACRHCNFRRHRMAGCPTVEEHKAYATQRIKDSGTWHTFKLNPEVYSSSYDFNFQDFC